MDARKSIKIRKNFSLKRNLISFNLENNERDIQNNSLRSKMTQSDSTTTEERKDVSSVKKSFHKKPRKLFISDFQNKKPVVKRILKPVLIPSKTTKKIISSNNLKYKKLRNYNCKKSNRSAKNKKIDVKILISNKNKDLHSKINNNLHKRKVFITDNDYNNILLPYDNYKTILKPSPPKNSDLHRFKIDSSNKNINNLANVNRQNFPHVLLNHLVFKNKTNVNTSNENNNLQISLTKRIKAKNLTILYYRPYL
jgi:hypothetical protein